MNSHNSVNPPTDRNWVAVVAIASNGVIGNQGSLPWRLSSDLKRFKQLTMGHCLVMGRKTYESIGRPLPGRQTIVLSQAGFNPAGHDAPTSEGQQPTILCAKRPEDVAALVEPQRRVMVVGGAQIYQAVMPHCSEIWLTRVLADVEGDVHFPEFDWNQWEQVSTESIPATERDQYPTEFQVWHRRAT